MDKQQGRRSPVAVLISTLTVVAILGVAVTAKHGQRNDSRDLASLESDLRLQLKLAYRHDTDQYEVRLEQLGQLLEAWLAAPQTAQDERLLTDWFHKAIRRSMPGKGQTLPAIPNFSTLDPPDPEPLTPAENLSVVAKDHVNDLRSAPSATTETREKETSKEIPAGVPVGFPYSQSPAEAKASSIGQRQSLGQIATEEDRPGAGMTVEPVDGPDQPGSDNSRPVAANPTSRVSDNSNSQLISHSSDRASLKGPIPVNLARLARRITGYHRGIDEVDALLPGLSKREASAARQPLGRLRELAEDYRFVKLYYETLSAEERWAVDKPKSLKPLCDQFAHVLNRQAPIPDGDYLGSIDADAAIAERPELRKLQDDLAWITTHLEE
jgi:hypothetical protein